MSGAKLDRFKSNPVALFNHKDYGPEYTGPIGQWENLRIEGGQLKAEFVPDNEDEFAAKIAGKVDRGMLKGASVGINIITLSEDPDVMLRGQKYPTVIEWEPFEASVVDIPSSQGALRLRHNGQDIVVQSDADMAKLGLTTTKPKSNDTMEFPESILTELGLDKNASDSDVLKAVQQMKADKKTAEDKLKADSEAAAKTFADGLKAELSLDDDKTESMRKLHMQDASLAMETATLMRGNKKEEKPARQTLRSQMGGNGGGNGTGGGDERANWTMRDWEKKDPQGLLKMKREDAEGYKELFNKTYAQ